MCFQSLKMERSANLVADYPVNPLIPYRFRRVLMDCRVLPVPSFPTRFLPDPWKLKKVNQEQLQEKEKQILQEPGLDVSLELS